MKNQLVQLYESAPAGTYPTDKHNDDHRTHGRSYLDVYGDLLDPVRLRLRSILEIGVLFGGSLWLWADYAPNAEVVGLDIDPEAKLRAESGAAGRNVKVVNGNQDSSLDLWRAVEAFKHAHDGARTIDLVVDDGSHVVGHMMHSFRYLWPHVSRGGFYVIEDMRCAYHAPSPNWPGMKYNDEKSWPADAVSLDGFVSKMMEDIHHQRGDCASIVICPMMMILQKA